MTKKNTIPGIDDKLFIETLRQGLNGENGGKYGGKPNPYTKAMGRYQFVPSHHWSSIQEFAKKNNYKADNYQDFINNKTLQDSYFEYYVRKSVMPLAKNLYEKYGLQRGLSIDEVGMLIHFQGTGAATKQMASGNFPKAEYKNGKLVNPGVKDYINNIYKKHRKSSGYNPIMYTADKYLPEWKKYSAAKKAIQNSNDTDDLKQTKLNDLDYQYQKKGMFGSRGSDGKFTGPFNQIIDRLNKDYAQRFLDKKNQIEEALSILNTAQARYETDEKGNKIIKSIDLNPSKGIFDSGVFKGGNKNERLAFDKKLKNPYISSLIKDKEKFFTSRGFNDNGEGKRVIELNPKSIEEIQLAYKKLTGNDLDLISKNSSGAYVFNNNYIDKDLIGGGSSGVFKNIPKTINSKFDPNKHGLSYLDGLQDYEDEDVVQEDNTPVDYDDPSYVPKKRGIVKTNAPSVINEGISKEEAQQKAADEIISQLEKKASEKTPQKDEYSIQDSVDWQLKQSAPKPTGYNPKDYKQEIPYAELLSSATQLISGQKMAKTDIPMRDEQVSAAYKNYTSELARLSQIGLKPEEEAYAKRMLTESYNSGLEQIVNASNGNRNIVLANLGRLDYQKQAGLLDIAFKDSQAKSEAFYKYGEAIKYINEFDANRDVANNERLYANAIRTKETGGALMAAGWKNLWDNIEYVRDNKPGSANHAYRSFMYRTMFNVDPGLKDDGTGNTPYTVSWNDKQNTENAKKHADLFGAAKLYKNMSDENKKVVDTFAEKSGGFDSEKTRNFIRDFSEKGFEPFDYSKIDNSLESNNTQSLWDNEELTPLNKKTDKNILFDDLNKNIESSALSQASKILNEISK